MDNFSGKLNKLSWQLKGRHSFQKTPRLAATHTFPPRLLPATAFAENKRAAVIIRPSCVFLHSGPRPLRCAAGASPSWTTGQFITWRQTATRTRTHAPSESFREGPRSSPSRPLPLCHLLAAGDDSCESVDAVQPLPADTDGSRPSGGAVGWENSSFRSRKCFCFLLFFQ